jgi:hypothetical protein
MSSKNWTWEVARRWRRKFGIEVQDEQQRIGSGETRKAGEVGEGPGRKNHRGKDVIGNASRINLSGTRIKRRDWEGSGWEGEVDGEVEGCGGEKGGEEAGRRYKIGAKTLMAQLHLVGPFLYLGPTVF